MSRDHTMRVALFAVLVSVVLATEEASLFGIKLADTVNGNLMREFGAEAVKKAIRDTRKALEPSFETHFVESIAPPISNQPPHYVPLSENIDKRNCVGVGCEDVRYNRLGDDDAIDEYPNARAGRIRVRVLLIFTVFWVLLM
jgi:hypothetical protein